MKFKYRIIQRRIKNARVEIRPGEVRIIVPPGIDPEKIVEKYHRWINKKIIEMEALEEKIRYLKPSNRSEEEFRRKIKTIIAEAEEAIGVKVKKISFRRMKTRWGSCSTSGRISINRLAVVLPEHLLRYIVFHEVAHLKEMNHSKAFYELLSRYCPEHRSAAEELRTWWFFIRKSLD